MTERAGEERGPAPRPTVLVTGAAKRVGRATALALAQRGCDLVLHYRTSDAEIEATRREIIERAESEGETVRVDIVRADLDDLADVERMGAEVAARLSHGLAGLVHNASSYAPSEFGSIRAEEILSHLRVNAVAPLLLTQALAPALRHARGAVVLFSDIHALGRPRRRFAPYLMSKAAVTNLVETLALELAPDVRINAIAPGVVAWPEHSDPKEVASYESKIPLARAGTVDEAAQAVAWLLLDAHYLTGDVIRIDGGRWLR